MIRNHRFSTAGIAFLLISIVFFGDARGNENSPLALYLTLLEDPLTQVTVNWHSKQNISTPIVEYRIKGDRRWQTNRGNTIVFPHSDRFIHRNKLTGLQPGSVYEFRIGGNQAVQLFRTMPAELIDSLIFVAGGDVHHNRAWMDSTSKAAAAVSPYFVALGGDLAYADGKPENVSRWYQFFNTWTDNMITPEGYLIPVIAGIGNHEVIGSYGNKPDNATFYFDLFGIPGKRAYYSVNAGDYLSMIILDTDHTSPIAGKQTEWLNQELRKVVNFSHIFPIYHVPAFPSHRHYDGDRNKKIRANWVPLFENYGVKIAFENHDHAFKRTFPIKNNRIDPDGVTYIGDGAWGVGTRVPVNTWYLDKAAAVRHFLKVKISPNLATVTAVLSNGDVLDDYSKSFAKPQSFIREAIPRETRLRQNHPNPFNPSTVIPVQLSSRQFVSIDVFDIRGSKVKTLFSDHMEAGNHSISFVPDGLPSGTYVCRLRTESYSATIKMMYIK